MEATSASAQALKEDRAEGPRDEVESGSIYSRHSSKRSRSSRSSTSSRVSYEAARARAKAEAAKTRLAFTEKEGELRVEKARLEAKIDYISLQKEAEAAQAEAEVLEAAAGDVNESNNKEFDFLPLPESALKRTDHYVTQHTQDQFPQEPKVENDSTLPPTSTPFLSYNQNAQPQLIDNGASFPQNNAQPFHMNFPQQEDERYQHRVLSDNRPHLNSSHNIDSSTDLAKFLAKSQLVSSGLTKFDDLPEHYEAWRETFINTIESLSLSASEEMDLLIKWLGKESGEHAIRIRSVNIRQPNVGLRMIWERLNKKYGAPEVIERALFCKLESFPKIHNRESQKLQELADLLTELDVAKREGYLPGLAYLDTSRGVQPIVEKLPLYLQDRWLSHGCKYKRDHHVAFPPFSYFKEFICREAEERNDPSFNYPDLFTNSYRKERSNQVRPVSVHKTNISMASEPKIGNPEKLCPMHHKPHSLQKCRGFRKLLLEERKRFLKENNICFRCCASTTHQAKSCEATVKCGECDSDKHISALHPGPASRSDAVPTSSTENGGERSDTEAQSVTSRCTQVCGDGFQGKSCSKICLVNVYPNGHQELWQKMYVILDDQSNVSLARSEFFDMFGLTGATMPYTLKTCAGIIEASGRRAHSFMIESLDGKVTMPLPALIECNDIPNNRSEIPTPEAACHHHHLKRVADKIPPLDPDADILLLLGRDIIRAHKVRDQYNGPLNAPYAQRLDLGWVIVGEVCIGGAHNTTTVSAMKTCILENGRPSHFATCENKIKVKEYPNGKDEKKRTPPNRDIQNASTVTNLGETVFNATENDNQLAHSIEDSVFLQIMEEEFFQDETKSWVAPLPFRHPRKRLPNNRCYAHHRLMSLRKTLDKKPEMKMHFTDFMQNMLDKGHAELAPPLQEGAECWYLPTFGVYHPKKPNKIRVVFDSSAQYDGISLNEVLLSGPDLNNSLVGVLLRFRKEPVAITADIQQMFYCFVVREDCRDFLRFLWYQDNDLSKDVVDYRMRVHVFGNSPSPAVAIFGLRKAAEHQEVEYGSDARHFVERDFYVDDGLRSFATTAEAIDVLRRTQQMLAASNITLHKIASNRAEVLNAFPADQRADNVKDLNLFVDDLPVQRSLGVSWNIMTDTFGFNIPENQKPFTRRGVLSTVNSLFDPLGFIAPVAVTGRLILRELTTENADWDAELPEAKKESWRRWSESLSALKNLDVPRAYASFSVSKAQHAELLIFCDASVKAISAVAYLKTTNEQGLQEVGFVFGKSKLAPNPGLTIPRLELCAAVMAVEIADLVMRELDLDLKTVKFYTDSRVVLGYIHNETRRFYVYVNNRVQRIRQSTQPEQWNYIPSELNPADHGSRSVPAAELADTTWLTGPAFLMKQPKVAASGDNGSTFDLVNPDADAEVRPEVTSLATQVSRDKLGSKRFQRFSSWTTLSKTVAHLCHIAQCFSHSSKNQRCVGWHMCKSGLSVIDIVRAEQIIIKCVQEEMYSEELKCIKMKHDLPKTSTLYKLRPILDSEGMLRIGGRIGRGQLETGEVHPLIIPSRSHVASLLVCHHHQAVKHQGRHFTEGAIRNSGLWIVGGKRLISSIIHKCVTCRKLRGRTEQQQMSDLPTERLQADPPFSYVGLDVFGPWEVVTRRTRGGQAQDKRWAVLFTCMSTRAIHIEVIETMTSSSFINALRRFFSIRGHAKQLRSDCGTNFTGAFKELKMDPGNKSVEDYLLKQKCTWVFNPPHSSHMGGAWERMIGVARRILDSMRLQVGHVKLTHEVLTTFMAEVSAIVNARPLIPVSTDPEAPFILTPSILLTQKGGVPSPTVSEFSKGDLLKNQWKRVQALADTFWARWRREYLSTLQSRHKWQSQKPNLKEGDIVLLKDDQTKRNQWPMGIIVKVVPSRDGLVRKVEVKVIRNQTAKVFSRPVSQVILLFSPQDNDSSAS
ncbi:uncharacterized protein LOC112848107 [Oreochromis niloticus]|uniref:uncharacterized protein LOC112848107 n=1 Tax=Oreochromis niloticus TaxID=8128 RepID=UPI000DF17DCA|nr:uncharacterized protein LOC112848107 [Oreochromis niloticus]